MDIIVWIITIAFLVITTILFSIKIQHNKVQIKNLNEKLDDFRADIYELIADLTDKQIGVEVSLRDYSKELVEKRDSEFSAKIELLTLIVKKILEENKELQKKLEFFTEIESDSKQLNAPNEPFENNSLIEKAINELSKGVASFTQVDSLPKEKEVMEHDTEIRDNYHDDRPVEANVIDDDQFVPSISVLDEEQKQAFLQMEYSNNNMFITGKAGTGKSFLLDLFSKITNKKNIKLAPTGRAAINVNGATIHSAFGFYNLEKLNLDELARSTIRLRPEKRFVLKHIETLIIDEVSMVRADIFDKIEKILRIVNDSNELFGGKQVILFGDPFQLPPVAKKPERDYLIDKYGGIHFFHSNSYKVGGFKFIELTTNHRQKSDFGFYNILNNIRSGNISSKDLDVLNRRVVNNRDEIRRIVTLFPTKAEADKVNREELAKIEAKLYTYEAIIEVNKKSNQTPLLESLFNIKEKLELKRGALVMFVKNDIDRRWVNGTLGIVSMLNNEEIIVSIDGRNHSVNKVLFEEREIVYKNGRLEYEDVLVVKQFPLILAYAITIHKSQGMTYKNVACDVEACFDTGQAYVALSRCTSLDGLHLLNPVTSHIANVDKDVQDFYFSQT